MLAWSCSSQTRKTHSRIDSQSIKLWPYTGNWAKVGGGHPFVRLQYYVFMYFTSTWHKRKAVCDLFSQLQHIFWIDLFMKWLMQSIGISVQDKLKTVIPPFLTLQVTWTDMNGYCNCEYLLHTTNPYLHGSKRLQLLLNTVTRVEPVKEYVRSHQSRTLWYNYIHNM